MFNRKKNRIAALENELEAQRQVAQSMLRDALTKLEEFDPETYQVGLGVMVAQRVNDQAKAQFEEMRRVHNQARIGRDEPWPL